LRAAAWRLKASYARALQDSRGLAPSAA
jgi:fructose-bisphosphate aldolase class 1